MAITNDVGTHTVIPPKEVTLYVGRNQRTYTKQVSPGQTFKSMIQSLGANPKDYLVFRPSDGLSFQNDDEVWNHVRDHDTLHLNLRATVGPDLREWRQKLLSELFGRTTDGTILEVEHNAEPSQPPHPSFAEVHGWRAHHNSDGSISYQGRFSVPGLITTWEGECLQKGGVISFKILKPPADLIGQTEWRLCFHQIHDKSGWYSVHFHEPQPETLDSGFAGIQYALQQTLLKAVGKEQR